MSQQATYARLEEREDEGGAADEIDKVEVQLELPEAPAGQEEPEEPEGKVLNVSVTDGGAALATFQYNCSEDDMDIVDFKSDLEAQLVKWHNIDPRPPLSAFFLRVGWTRSASCGC